MRLRTRVAAIVGATVFLALGGNLGASALWSSPATTTADVRAADLRDACTNPVAFTNASFESPVIPTGSVSFQNNVPGWTWTNAAGQPVRGELWPNGHEGVIAPVGNQFAELNADVPGTLSQTLTTSAGQTMHWSFMHRGRSGNDTIELRIGAPGAPVLVDTFTTGTTGGMGGWRRYSGVYVVPQGQAQTQLSFIAGATASGNASVGNFLDDVSFGTGPCLTASSTIAKVTAGSASYHATNTAQFTTTVANVGSMLASNAVLQFAVPVGVEPVADSILIGGSARTTAIDGDSADFDPATRIMTIRMGTGATNAAGGMIAQGSSLAVSFRGVIQPSAAGTTITYQPTVGYTNELATSWPLSVAPAPVSIQVQQPSNLQVTTTATPITTLNRGTAQTVRWDFRLRNQGPLTAESPVLTVQLPAALASGAAPLGGNVTCTVPTAQGVSTCTPSVALMADGVIDVYVERSIPTTSTVGTVYTVSATATAASYDPADDSSASYTLTINDTQAPTTPGAITATNTTRTGTTLSWGGSSDNVGVTGYRVYRDGAQVATVTGTTWTATGLAGGTVYSWRVDAIDAAGNVSDRSSELQLRTRAAAVSQTTAFRVVNESSSRCLAYVGFGSPYAIQQQTCSTANAQVWRLYETAANSGVYTVRPDASSSWLWSFANATNANGQALQLVPIQTVQTRQQFELVQEFDGTFSFKVQSATNSCVDVPNSSTANNVTLQQYVCNSSGAQKFRLEVVN